MLTVVLTAAILVCGAVVGTTVASAYESEGALGKYYVQILSCTPTTDYYGYPALIVTANWTNNSDETTSFGWAISWDAFQNGIQCDENVYFYSNPAYVSNQYVDVRPGATLQVMLAFRLQDTTAPVEVELSAWASSSDTIIYAAFDPATGAFCEAPVFTKTSAKNLGDYYIEITGARLTTDSDDNPALIVTANWTNNSDRTVRYGISMSWQAFQNGIECGSAHIYSDASYVNNQSVLIRPGVTIQVMMAFVLRDTTTPVEIELKKWPVAGNQKIIVTYDPTTNTFLAAPQTYTLTVNNGTGSGQYTAGAVVAITANEALSGKVFDRWTGAAVADATAAATTITMPAGNATVTATYKTASDTSGRHWWRDMPVLLKILLGIFTLGIVPLIGILSSN
ncbi:MAG: DUF5067 domain-containing protein [Oscillospiraceae bacterium]|nr:DUF5067 domain-containing protein [Oscillospiraceae bacterium]